MLARRLEGSKEENQKQKEREEAVSRQRKSPTKETNNVDEENLDSVHLLPPFHAIPPPRSQQSAIPKQSWAWDIQAKR